MPVNVPNLPGVPALNFAVSALTTAQKLLTGDTLSGGWGSDRAWGIYKGGAPVVTADTVLTVDHKAEWAVSDFPVERGGFESYNKVRMPFDARVRFAAGGSDAARRALLESIDAIAGTTQIFDVVTPEKVFSNVTITHHDHRRAANSGLGLIQIDVWCLEVRESANATAGTSTAAPDGAAQSNGGAVQAGAAATEKAAPVKVAMAKFGRAAGPV